ncbi:MAG TPA: hypothetical protein VGR43_02400 [Dehalococcoidia bacterium]|nr:hypothetical protein [Dehalococcoidia bacterium]
MRESRFAHHYRSQAFRTYAFQEARARRPFVRLLAIPGYTYLRIGTVVFIRDGWRLILKGAA